NYWLRPLRRIVGRCPCTAGANSCLRREMGARWEADTAAATCFWHFERRRGRRGSVFGRPDFATGDLLHHAYLRSPCQHHCGGCLLRKGPARQSDGSVTAGGTAAHWHTSAFRTGLGGAFGPARQKDCVLFLARNGKAGRGSAFALHRSKTSDHRN